MRVAPLEEASSRRRDLFGGKDNPFLSADISDSIEPNRDGVRGRAAILWGMGLKAVRMNTANLCSSACSPTTSWVWGFGSGHVVAFNWAMQQQIHWSISRKFEVRHTCIEYQYLLADAEHALFVPPVSASAALRSSQMQLPGWVR
ncbi:MAG: hypothetical protein Q9188_000501 [Gyalolechia gomerana]